MSKNKEVEEEWKLHIFDYTKKIEALAKDLGNSQSQIQKFKKIQKEEAAKVRDLENQKNKISVQAEELLNKKSEIEIRNKEYEKTVLKWRDAQKRLSEVLHEVESLFLDLAHDEKALHFKIL